MRVAVIGSWRESDRDAWALSHRDDFRAAAGLLGRRLIEFNHSLVVGSDRSDTADFLAVEGAVSVAGETTKRIHILAPSRHQETFGQLRRRSPRLFVEHAIPTNDWAPAKVFQVRYADAVVILGGAQASQQAGLTAAVSGKRLVCLGAFGGAARRLNDLLAQSRGSWNGNVPDVETIGVLQNPWHPMLMDDVLAALRALHKPKVLIVHGRAEDRDDLKRFLREDRGLADPVVLADLKTPSSLIASKFETLAADVDAAIALCTPDDVGGLSAATVTLTPRARQNVWLEIGWFWGRLGLRRILVLTRGSVDVPSDLEGIERYAYEQSPRDRAEEIDAFLASVGQSQA